MDTASKDTNPKDAIGVRKVPYSTVPMNVVAEIGLGMMEGARKYGRHNYRAIGVRASVYFDATMRHLARWWEGEDIDTESGLNHITKAITSLVVLRDAMMQDKVTDDRPPQSVKFIEEFNKKASDIIDKHPEAKEPYTQSPTPRFNTKVFTVDGVRESWVRLSDVLKKRTPQ